MKVILCLAVLLAVCYVATCYTDHEEQQFAEFKVNFQKKYDTQEEESKRKGIFAETLRTVEAHNKLYEAGKSTYSQGINQFADLRQDEVSTGLAG